ncbi:MAG: hypothetical protein AAGM38_10330 [Pseudomonadota bacterium]
MRGMGQAWGRCGAAMKRARGEWARRAAAGLAACAAAMALSACAVDPAVRAAPGFGPGLQKATAAYTPSTARSEVIAAADRQRGAVVAQVPFSVSLWLRRAGERQFMVHRSDLQPMFDLEWSRERAELAVTQAYGGDCRSGSDLAVTQAVWDPVGVWVIDGVCG